MSDKFRKDVVSGGRVEMKEAFDRNVFPAALVPETSISASARAEIENERDRDSAFDAHDQRWKNTQERLANSALPAPEFDLGEKPIRDLESEYRQWRGAWERETGRLEQQFEARKQEIREEWPNLSSAFEIVRNMPEPDFKAHHPDVMLGKKR